MNKEQIKILERSGALVTFIPSSRPQPRATYYSRNKVTGGIVQHNLPADPYSLQHYLGKGFKLNLQELTPQTEEGEFVCTVCGKEFKAKIGLLGHMRTHQK